MSIVFIISLKNKKTKAGCDIIVAPAITNITIYILNKYH